MTPRGGRDAIEGSAILADGRVALKARVRAAPEAGAANAALLRLLAKALALPLSALTLTSGAAARLKIVAIAGDAVAISAGLAALVGHGAQMRRR